MATTNAPDGGFRRWRRSRPFWGGLLLLIAGLELFLSANMTLGDLEVHMGPEGFLSYLLPLLLILTGLLSVVTPGQRLFYGVLGLLTAVYSLVGLNLGGFGIGMMVGIVGGALVLAWAPTPTKPQAAAPVESDEEPATQDAPEENPRPQPYGHDPAATMIVPGFPGGDETAPLRPAHQPEQFPTEPAYPGEEHPPRPPSSGIPRKTFVITLVPLVLTAAVLIAGSQTPARAAVECPEGLPSRPAAAAKKEAVRQSPAAKKTPKAKAKAKPSPSTAAPASAAPTASATDGTGNPIVDGWNGFVEGVGDLLGIGGEEEAEPTPDPSTAPEAPATPEPTASAGPSAPTHAPSGKPGESTSPTPGASSGSASPSPTPSLPDVPCLGPRVFKEAGPDDIPVVSAKGSTLETKSLTMYNSTYDGVIELDTTKGKVAALKFSMTKAVNEPFTLTVPEPGGLTTLIKSNKLTTDGNVRFYTPEFKGKLFGVIPVTFTPESPPPLTLPVLWFTDVEINLAFVRCDTLTGEPLKVTEKA
ncbi:hypothetical protein DMB66_00305 [Actinoplanes sp. ATCC 53533]|uniref:DUF6114 domain-containing protein n=1 Tax=Actinoplanes sp. ATCC 53533 TaxID=1288362 RepID=UPI000F7AEE0D|nr:DUF6114 domain-containing protein [Actinoplanes sp. ATCC 53533]RSM74829.1 hypothetical protein DMB66_00305 [Actinoplanes sp. ATCC 53533]